MLQNIALGGMMIALPIYFQMVFEYTAMQTGLRWRRSRSASSSSPSWLAAQAGKRRASRVIQVGYALLLVGIPLLIPLIPRAASGWSFIIPLLITGSGLGLLVSQLNNYTLSPISEERVSEAAGVNSAGGSFGLSFGLAFAGAIMLAALAISFNTWPDKRGVVPCSTGEGGRGAGRRRGDHERYAARGAAGGPARRVQAEILRINTEARNMALQVALLVPFLASLLGLLNSFRMVRAPDPEPLSSAEGMVVG